MIVVDRTIEMLEALIAEYGWSWEYITIQPLTRLTLLYQYGIDRQIEKYKANPVNTVIDILVKVFSGE